MLIREAMSVFWQTLKDVWEELYTLAIVNLVWLFSWALPVLLAGAIGSQIPVLFFVCLALALGAFAVTASGIYVVTNRVARGKTFHFYDFIEGIKVYWWRSLLWMLGNVVFLGLIFMNVTFYPNQFEGLWAIMFSGLWLAVGAFWLTMQMYFWPVLIELDEPKLLLAWRNCAYSILANPFYSFFVVSFSLVLLVLSVALTLPFIFVGMGLLAILANNAILTLYFKLGIIEDPRPPVPTG
jgi:hypothetical protein